ncbi:hypothetical protein K438DRAFT_2001374 [Mycena galopus ATCC 62051]|nr:hypothetical protein K438DRAFT_2001374 [Mycena galopus ATCC 62051]
MSEPLPKPAFQHHDEFYFADGGLILRTTDGILYNVYRAPLAKKSGFFAGLLDLPYAVPAGQALVLPGAIDSEELDALFDFIFNFKPWTTDLPSLSSLCAILKLSHFFDIETGTDYAIHHLAAHPHLNAPMRLYLACTYDVEPWVSKAFNELMAAPIDEITRDDEQLIGRVAYRLLVKTHAKVDRHRHELAFYPPIVQHSAGCKYNIGCQQAWEEAWFGRAGSGMVTALLDAKIPGKVLYETMPQFQAFRMLEECRVLTIATMEDTPERPGGLNKEHAMIENAIKELKRTTQH